MPERKIFTFHFAYEGDDFNEIRFCAHTKNEAIQLYNTWCVTDAKQAKPYPLTEEITVVYDESDAAEYGDNYGSPTEYKGE